MRPKIRTLIAFLERARHARAEALTSNAPAVPPFGAGNLR